MSVADYLAFEETSSVKHEFVGGEVTIFRRAQGWAGETHVAPDARVDFLSVKQSMTLGEIYDGVP